MLDRRTHVPQNQERTIQALQRAVRKRASEKC